MKNLLKFDLSIRKIIISITFVVLCMQVYSQPKDWATYRIPGIIDIKIPPNMELQGGKYKEIKDANIASGKLTLSREIIDHIEKSIIFQQEGLNDFKKEAYETYARIIINYDVQVDDGFGPILSNMDLPPADLLVLDKLFKEQSIVGFKSQGIVLLKWYGTKLVQKNGYSAIAYSYLRQLNTNKPVYVEQYKIFNRGTEITITISSREDEKNSTYKDIWKVIDYIQLLAQ